MHQTQSSAHRAVVRQNDPHEATGYSQVTPANATPPPRPNGGHGFSSIERAVAVGLVTFPR